MTKTRILVIDDEQISREGVAEVLTDEGYEVRMAADGHEGVSFFATFQPHLVLTDLQMPHLGGIGVINHVKSVSPTTPIIIFTADIVIDAQRTAERLGVADYINKPLNFEEMLRRIEQVLKR
jgi:DNA-binding response OmpR family regulator